LSSLIDFFGAHRLRAHAMDFEPEETPMPAQVGIWQVGMQSAAVQCCRCGGPIRPFGWLLTHGEECAHAACIGTAELEHE
jgi:hypothetical protein